MTRYQPITELNIARNDVWQKLSAEEREGIEVVSKVLPFRTNEYVVRELIDWSRVPDDPLYQMTFVQRGMLSEQNYSNIRDLLARGASDEEIRNAANGIRRSLNPQPDGQLTLNVPHLDGKPLPGLQHKYKETVLFFPGQGQTCHAYCTYCFRWAQFVDLPDVRFQSWETDNLVAYLKAHPEVTDLLITGGDPMIMKTSVLRRYIEPLLAADLPHLRNIRIGTKALSYWPQRFVTDKDADDVLRLFEQVVESGRHLALMAHYSHPAELGPEIARTAVRRVRSSGAEIRLQAPVLHRVNDDPDAWAGLWRAAVTLGMFPYYMFIERDTGPRQYFEVPLFRTHEIFRQAYNQISGLARSVRGPVMSASPGKVRVLGVSDVAGEKCFVLDFLQARNPERVRRPFFARFDPAATWFDQLEPLFENDRHFFDHLPQNGAGGEPGSYAGSYTVQGGAGAPRLTVVKVGGSLLEDRSDLHRVASSIVARRRDGEPLLIVGSALKGVTDLLDRAATQAVDPALRNGPLGQTLESLRRRHLEMSVGLADGGPILRRIEEELGRIEALVDAIRDAGDLQDTAYARLLSSGERLSVILLAAAIEAAGGKAEAVASEEAGLRASGPRRSGSCDIAASAPGLERLRSQLRDRIPVLTGFYGLDDGGVVLFGRGGSDNTACAVAAGLNADRLELWKDVPGFMSADPCEVSDARLIDQISFDEVAQMGAYGSCVVNHGCLEPLRGRSTRVLISSIEGRGAGTLLVETLRRESTRVVALASRRGKNGSPALIGAVGDGVAHDPGIRSRMLACLSEAGVRGDLVAEPSGRSGLSCRVHPDDLARALSGLHDRFIASSVSPASPESQP
jgi:KamA family protein